MMLPSCTHTLEGGRGPASASTFSKACEQLSTDERKVFDGMLKSQVGIAKSLDELSTLASLLKVDQSTYEKSRITINDFISREHGIMFGRLQTFAKILLGECALLRDGDDPNAYVTKKGHPAVYKRVEQICGLHDTKLAAKDRVHPNMVRDWTNFEVDAMDIDLRLWSSTANLIYNPSTGDVMAPDRVADLCADFKSRKNIEDIIENLFVCMDAFVVSLYEYDWYAGKYAFDANKQLKFKAQRDIKKITGCVQAHVDTQISVAKTEAAKKQAEKKQAANNLPKTSGGAPGSKTDPKTESKNETKTKTKTAQGNKPTGETKPADGKFGSQIAGCVACSKDGKKPHNEDGKWYGLADPSKPVPKCMPGDKDDSACREDRCLDNFRYYTARVGTQLDPKLTSKQMIELYDGEKKSYAYQIAKNTARLLGQGYVVTAYQRHWDSPKEFNANLREFVNSCSGKLGKELAEMAKVEMLDERTLDNSYDPVFADQRESSDDKGRRMVEAVDRIIALRELVGELHAELGAKEVETYKIPKWVGYYPAGKLSAPHLFGKVTGLYEEVPYLSDFEIPIPILRLLVGADFAIKYGNHTDYQCNSISTIIASSHVKFTRDLLKPSDMRIRELVERRPEFYKRAFCTRDGRCEFPSAFQAYLDGTSNSTFAYADRLRAEGYEGMQTTIPLRNWCSMRWNAAQALIGLEYQLFAQYPALGHSDIIKGKHGKKDEPGKPLFERLHEKLKAGESKEQVAKYAADEANRVLGGIQADIKKFVSRVCSDIERSEYDTTFMTVLAHREFLGGLDYCSSVPSTDRRNGLTCPDREAFLGCKLQADADHWRMIKDMPGFALEVGMMGLDALFVSSILRGTLMHAFNAKGLIAGGITGLGFTGATYGISHLIAQNNESQWNDINKASAALALEGVDSYTNALTSLIASQPEPRMQDFVLGFVMGAMMGGGGAKNAPKPKVGAPPAKGGKGGASAETLAEVTKKVSEAGEKSGTGVKFAADRLSRLKTWLMQKTGENPGLADQLTRNLGEALNALPEGEYAKLFERSDGKVALARVRKALAVRLRHVSQKFGEALGKAKSELSLKRLKNEKMTPDEALLHESSLQAVELAKTAENLGPREIAAIADAAEEAARAVAGEKPAARTQRLSNFLRKLCGLSAWCPALQGVKSCPL